MPAGGKVALAQGVGGALSPAPATALPRRCEPRSLPGQFLGRRQQPFTHPELQE